MPRPRTRPQTRSSETDGEHMIDCSSISPSLLTQSRAELSTNVVAEYVDLLDQGVVFPAIELARINNTDSCEDATTRNVMLNDLVVLDGFHRLKATLNYGAIQILGNITTMNLSQAIARCVQSNAAHGLRRTNADKRKAVCILLARPEWQNRSNREIAIQCHVTHPFVQNVKESLSPAIIPADPASALDPEQEGLSNWRLRSNYADSILKDFSRQLKLLNNEIGGCAVTMDGRFLNFAAISADIQNAIQGIDSSRPEQACPICQNGFLDSSCRLCRGGGWVSRLVARHGLPVGLTTESLQERTTEYDEP